VSGGRDQLVPWTTLALIVLAAAWCAAEPIAGFVCRARVYHADPARSAVTAGGVVDGVDPGAGYVGADSGLGWPGTGLGPRRDRPELELRAFGPVTSRLNAVAPGSVSLRLRFQNDAVVRWDTPCDSARRREFGDSTRFRRGEVAGYAFRDLDAVVACSFDSVTRRLWDLSAVGDEGGHAYWLWTEAREESAGVVFLRLRMSRTPPGGFGLAATPVAEAFAVDPDTLVRAAECR
jgi:hypothetical protein